MRTKAVNEVTMDFPSQSRNESFARSAAACFAAQLDPTLNELEDIKTAVSPAGGCPLWSRPGMPCFPPGERSAAAWALPSWRALWIR